MEAGLDHHLGYERGEPSPAELSKSNRRKARINAAP